MYNFTLVVKFWALLVFAQCSKWNRFITFWNFLRCAVHIARFQSILGLIVSVWYKWRLEWLESPNSRPESWNNVGLKAASFFSTKLFPDGSYAEKKDKFFGPPRRIKSVNWLIQCTFKYPLLFIDIFYCMVPLPLMECNLWLLPVQYMYFCDRQRFSSEC